MNPDERVERLEQRVATLEELVRRLVESRPTARPAPAPQPQRPAPRPAAPASQNLRPARPASAGRRLDSEEWIGQRGLLAVGVTALIMAAGYLLKLSFDRGWVSPLVRCIGGAVAGGAVGGVGWRLGRRYRTYGAALVGCGAAIIYLAVWAAVRQYHFLPLTPGVAGLALVSLGLAAVAFALDVEALGATAAVGAFFAPVFLSPERGNADALLVYLAAMAAALGVVSAIKRWRLAALLVAASYFGIGWVAGASAGGSATPTLLLGYGVAGGTAGLFLGLRERWWEVRGLSFWGGWALIASASHATSGGLLLMAALIMAAPLWWHGLRTPNIWPSRTTPRYRGSEWSIGEALYFFVTPVFLAWAVARPSPEFFDARRGLAALLVGLPYAIVGYIRPRPAFALAGAAALAVGACLHWPGLAAVWALLLLALLWAALDHPTGRSDGRWYAAGTLLAALLHLTAVDSIVRSAGDAAFTGEWALALWAATLVTALLAARLWRPVGDAETVTAMRTLLWIVAGALLLFGGTGEIRRYFAQHVAARSAADLAGGLAVSAWWLVFATWLVLHGFRRGSRPVRRFGLGVAALAGAKVLLVDLRSLDALYRVGSVFALGLASLLVAYLYHRHARGPATSAGESDAWRKQPDEGIVSHDDGKEIS